MNDYLLLMHNDAPAADASNGEAWGRYFVGLRESGRFSGGSSIGTGVCVSKTGSARGVTSHLSGYIRVRAQSIDEARKFVVGNPVFEAGGTIEIRELPRD
jgi:hypothetical protein